MQKTISVVLFVLFLSITLYFLFVLWTNTLYVGLVSPEFMEIKVSDLKEADKKTVAKVAESLAKQHEFTENMWRNIANHYIWVIFVSLLFLLASVSFNLFVVFKSK